LKIKLIKQNEKWLIVRCFGGWGVKLKEFVLEESAKECLHRTRIEEQELHERPIAKSESPIRS